MDVRYRYGHRPGRRRRTRVLIVLAVSLLIIGLIGGAISYDVYKNSNKGEVQGVGRTIAQAPDETVNKFTINEPSFSMELPGDWKEQLRINQSGEHSITWQATKAHEDNRLLTVYIDTIPAKRSINRLLPVTVMGNTITVGDISDNCATFTQGGTLNTAKAQSLQDAPAKYKGVDFICDLPRVIDNEVGTGSVEGSNGVTIKGGKGEHKYFFLFTDHNIQPNYNIFYTALRSFAAK